MPLSPGPQIVAVQSVRFPSAFLRMDASDVTQFEGSGSGTVNCQFYESGSFPKYEVGNYEVFEIIPLNGAISAFAIKALNFQSAFLRMDGSSVSQSQGGGSGIVNCQYYDYPSSTPTVGGDYEFLVIREVFIPNLSQAVYCIQSGPFPNAFLRMDGSNVTQSEGGGSGTVNCQYYSPGTMPASAQDYELFYLISPFNPSGQ